MATVLDKELKRRISVDGADYVVSIDAQGMRLTGKGKRKPAIDLRWQDLLSGEAAMAVALNASLLGQPRAPANETAAGQARSSPTPAPKKKAKP